MNETTDFINPADGLLYCGKCRTPKQAYFPDGQRFGNLDRHPVLCQCAAAERVQKEAEEEQRRHFLRVENLRTEAFSEIPAAGWTFENAPIQTPQLEKAKRYADRWDECRRENIGLLLFGDVGTGKSYAAGCIANALIEKEIPVYFINLATAVNRMQGSMGDERERYVKSLLRPELLILDDLGTERSTSYGRERVFDIVNRRNLSRKPMIVTTNIPLSVMKTEKDIDLRRIYDRILEVCAPVNFDGKNFRTGNAAELRGRATEIIFTD